MIIVLDCNIWISLTINRQLDYVVRMAEMGIKIASCSELRAEITDVLARSKLQKFVPPESCAKSKANYLVSGDKLVLQVGIYDKTKLITLSDLEAITSNL